MMVHHHPPDPAAAAAAPQPPRPERRPIPALRWLFVAILGIHAALAFTQSILAGAYLTGKMNAMTAHGVIGSGLTVLVMLQGVAALLFWVPGRGPWWPLIVTGLLFFVEGFQVGMGYARALGVHIPLGVALILINVAMFGWALLWRPKRTRVGS